jgi:hypothetical protein
MRNVPAADADDDGELGLPVQPRRLRTVDGNVVEGADHRRGRRLEEEERRPVRRKRLGAHLGDVPPVVDAGADHLARIAQRREQPDAVQRRRGLDVDRAKRLGGHGPAVDELGEAPPPLERRHLPQVPVAHPDGDERLAVVDDGNERPGGHEVLPGSADAGF